ncbi:uncharacterized protein LOC143602001 [Bidens hawaiensis]|uniref:uncharacterized protein LOC143602001 n=1 Tax=Bidens hawaiensis TaxID=980011 RepID=UPI00404ADA62
MSVVNLSHIRSVWGNAQFDFAVASAKGKSGGIMSVWNPLMFTKHAILCMGNMVIVKGEWKKLKVECYMVNVYAPQDENEKKNLWCLIESLMSHHPGMYCLFGNFNSVRFPEERLGLVFSSRNATNFNDFIDRLGVVDIPLGGLKFTRVDSAGKKFSKLDRFLLSEGLLDSAPNLEATIICSRLSDHRPIVLKQKEVNYGAVPFKFYNSWLNWEGLDKVVQDSWELEIQVRSMYKLKEKFKRLKNILKEWVKHVQKNHSETKFELQADSEKCEMEMEQGKGSDSVLLRRNEVRYELHKIEANDSAELALKCKNLWPKLGDENSKFFHNLLKKQRRQQAITGIKAEGVWVDDPDQLKRLSLIIFLPGLRK